MFAFLESSVTHSSCSVQSLSWMGRVTSTVEQHGEEETLRLYQSQYYSEGWLANGNSRGIVGVTFTSSSMSNTEIEKLKPFRSNFNLRGHRTEVVIVRWNEPYQKLATCDISGIIFVWTLHEGRWSIELINDRNNQVTDFSWSHNGRMALISYRDGFVLVGSVTGQRHWSYSLNLNNCYITCGIWMPDDREVVFGTTDGQVIVMSAAGIPLAQLIVCTGSNIQSMAWSCEKFQLIEEREKSMPSSPLEEGSPKSHILAVSFRNGIIYLMNNCFDIAPRRINTNLSDIKIEWANSLGLLAVGGNVQPASSNLFINNVQFYTIYGTLLYRIHLPETLTRISALTWGHNDKRLFVAVGSKVFTLRVSEKVASLQQLCCCCIKHRLSDELKLTSLPIPSRVHRTIAALYSQTIKGYIPQPLQLQTFVCGAPSVNERLYCTMIRYGDEASSVHYVLYLEHFGGLIPLLKGKRCSKIKTDFVIYQQDSGQYTAGTNEKRDPSVESESDDEGSAVLCDSPRARLKSNYKQNGILNRLAFNDVHVNTNRELATYGKQRLAEISSNVWGTKFTFKGKASCLPVDLGQVVYKTSLLHLQPRQMKLRLRDLTDTYCDGLGKDNHSNENFTVKVTDGWCGSDDEVRNVEASQQQSPLGTCQLNGSNEGSNISLSVASVRPVGSYLINSDMPSRLTVTDISEGSTSSDTKARDSLTNLLCSPITFRRCAQSPTEATVPCSSCFVENTCSLDLKHCENVHSSITISNHDNISETVIQIPLRTTATVLLPEEKLCTVHKTCCSTSHQSQYNNRIDYNNRCNLATDHLQIKFIDEDSNSSDEDNSNSRVCIWPTNVAESSPTSDTAADSLLQITDNQGPVQPQSVHSKRIVLLCCGLKNMPRSKASQRLLSNEISGTPPLSPSNESAIGFNSRRSSAENLRRHAHNGRLLNPVKSASLPSSPAHHGSTSKKVRKSKRNGVLRKELLRNTADSSDDEAVITTTDYTNLETFQKARFSRKLASTRHDKQAIVPKELISSEAPKARYLTMHNREPIWNDVSQVYQLDFGGRVTQESAKNFQIEYQNRQVMQFGRIDSNAYTLDFEHPFTAVQAFAVALANVTQRLK